jgi:hypothetical protein
MIKLTIKPKIAKFLESLEIPWDEIENLLRPEFQRKKKIKQEPEKPKVTLDRFFGGKESA